MIGGRSTVQIDRTETDRTEDIVLRGPVREKPDDRFAVTLTWFAVLVAGAATSGVLLYCYDRTLAGVRGALVWMHNVSGDVAACVLVVYLVRHLIRTWTLRHTRPVSWWFGMLSVIAWAVAIAAGFYGQLFVLRESDVGWWAHTIASVAAIVLTGFHAAYGFRARSARLRGYP